MKTPPKGKWFCENPNCRKYDEEVLGTHCLAHPELSLLVECSECKSKLKYKGAQSPRPEEIKLPATY